MEIETIIKILSKNKAQDQMAPGKFYQKFREALTGFRLKLFRKIAEDGKLPNPFYEATITLIPKSKMPQE